jgi:hypothetical protein
MARPITINYKVDFCEETKKYKVINKVGNCIFSSNTEKGANDWIDYIIHYPMTRRYATLEDYTERIDD